MKWMTWYNEHDRTHTESQTTGQTSCNVHQTRTTTRHSVSHGLNSSPLSSNVGWQSVAPDSRQLCRIPASWSIHSLTQIRWQPIQTKPERLTRRWCWRRWSLIPEGNRTLDRHEPNDSLFVFDNMPFYKLVVGRAKRAFSFDRLQIEDPFVADPSFSGSTVEQLWSLRELQGSWTRGRASEDWAYLCFRSGLWGCFVLPMARISKGVTLQAWGWQLWF